MMDLERNVPAERQEWVETCLRGGKRGNEVRDLTRCAARECPVCSPAPSTMNPTPPANPAGGEVSAQIISTFSVAIPNAKGSLGPRPALSLSVPDEEPPAMLELPPALAEGGYPQLAPAPNIPAASHGPGVAGDADAGGLVVGGEGAAGEMVVVSGGEEDAAWTWTMPSMAEVVEALEARGEVEPPPPLNAKPYTLNPRP